VKRPADGAAGVGAEATGAAAAKVCSITDLRRGSSSASGAKSSGAKKRSKR